MIEKARTLVLKGGLIRDAVGGGLYRVLYVSPDAGFGY